MELREQEHLERALKRRLGQLERELEQLRIALLEAERELFATRQLEADFTELRQSFDDELRRLETDRDDALRALEADRDGWIERYHGVIHSRSWRLSSRLRRLGRTLRGPQA